MKMTSISHSYFFLAKPGIIMGNLVTTAGAFALASSTSWSLGLLLAVILGLSGVMGSACVLNNYIDRKADREMIRTQNRALAKGTIPVKQALWFACVLGVVGMGILTFFSSLLTVLMAFLGFITYVFLYSFLKYRSAYATWIGSLAGAVPPLVGYCAAKGAFDQGAWILLAMLVFWQMSHFFSIAIYRLSDYAAASIPVWPLDRGIYSTKWQMIIYSLLFTIACSLLVVFGYAGWSYLWVIGASGFLWLIVALRGVCIYQGKKGDNVWARQMFICSLIVIMATFLSMPLFKIDNFYQ